MLSNKSCSDFRKINWTQFSCPVLNVKAWSHETETTSRRCRALVLRSVVKVPFRDSIAQRNEQSMPLISADCDEERVDDYQKVNSLTLVSWMSVMYLSLQKHLRFCGHSIVKTPGAGIPTPVWTFNMSHQLELTRSSSTVLPASLATTWHSPSFLNCLHFQLVRLIQI